MRWPVATLCQGDVGKQWHRCGAFLHCRKRVIIAQPRQKPYPATDRTHKLREIVSIKSTESPLSYFLQSNNRYVCMGGRWKCGMYPLKWLIIPWHDLLLMLEGDVVHLPAPKTHCSTDICLQRDTPIFATGKVPPPNLRQERSNWPTRNGYDVPQGGEFWNCVIRFSARRSGKYRPAESAFLSSLWVAFGNRELTIVITVNCYYWKRFVKAVHIKQLCNGSHNMDSMYCSFSFIGHVNRWIQTFHHVNPLELLKNNVNRLKRTFQMWYIWIVKQSAAS